MPAKKLTPFDIDAEYPDDFVQFKRNQSVANSSCFQSVQKYKSGPECETAIDDDSLASNHRRSHTQEYNYISYVLRRAGALQKGAVD